MRKRIKVTGFSDWETMFYNNLLSIPVLVVFSILVEDWSFENITRNLYVHSSIKRMRTIHSFSLNIAQQRVVTSFCLPSHFQARLQLVYRTRLHGVFERQAVQHIGVYPCFDTSSHVKAHAMMYFSMVGALNKLPVAASGMLFFGDAVTFGSVSAIGLGFFAGVVYAVAKNNQKKAENRTQADAIIPLSNRRL